MIDWGVHARDAAWVVAEIWEFDQSVQVAVNFAKKDGNMLVIVTADALSMYQCVVWGWNGTDESDHTSKRVPVFAFGTFAYRFQGEYDNTDLGRRLFDAVG